MRSFFHWVRSVDHGVDGHTIKGLLSFAAFVGAIGVPILLFGFGVVTHGQQAFLSMAPVAILVGACLKNEPWGHVLGVLKREVREW